jgi:hypothetical protein
MPRLDTKLESEGAEFLVLGNLLLHRIPTYKTYNGMAGYDLVATNPANHTSARIQVKSRWETGSSGFPISNFNCDFVVAAFLNRGSKDERKKVGAPWFYVFPISVINGLPRLERWNKVYLRNFQDVESYKDNWSLISKFLARVENKSVQGTGTGPSSQGDKSIRVGNADGPDTQIIET